MVGVVVRLLAIAWRPQQQTISCTRAQEAKQQQQCRAELLS